MISLGKRKERKVVFHCKLNSIRYKLTIKIWEFLIVSLLFAVSFSDAQDRIVLKTANESPNSPDNLDGICGMIAKESFRRIGMDRQIVRLPSERALLKVYWDDVASYINKHSEVLFSHGMCPDCEKKAYEELGRLIQDNERKDPT